MLSKLVNPLGIVKETKVWLCLKMLWAEPARENEMANILRVFEIQTDHQIWARIFQLVLNNLSSIGFCRFSNPQRKNKRNQKDYEILCQKIEKCVEHEVDSYTWNWGNWTQRKNPEHPDQSTVWIGLITLKSTVDQSRFAITGT